MTTVIQCELLMLTGRIKELTFVFKELFIGVLVVSSFDNVSIEESGAFNNVFLVHDHF